MMSSKLDADMASAGACTAGFKVAVSADSTLFLSCCHYGRVSASKVYNLHPNYLWSCQLSLTEFLSRMDLGDHVRTTGGALKNWIIAQLQDSLAVAALWLIGLYLLKVPWAPFWALLAAVLQFVPHVGPALGMIGPALTAALSWKDWEHPLYVLILYAAIVVVDGLLLQPYIMKRTAKVPIWASILTPLVLGILIPFWGVLLAPPLLAVLYAYKARQNLQEVPPRRPGPGPG
jgi:predicted PurR-regulated permease PerM